MAWWPRLLCLLFLLVEEGPAQECPDSCGALWAHGLAARESEFHSFTETLSPDTEYLNWQWSIENNTKVWDVYLHRWKSRDVLKGGFKLRSQRAVLANLNWQLVDSELSWMSGYRAVPAQPWAIPACDQVPKLELKPEEHHWYFNIGSVKIKGGESGRQSNMTRQKLVEEDKREKRSAPIPLGDDVEMSAEQKESMWTKLKGYFKELMDQGEDDPRDWWERLSDWAVAFLERVLS